MASRGPTADEGPGAEHVAEPGAEPGAAVGAESAGLEARLAAGGAAGSPGETAVPAPSAVTGVVLLDGAPVAGARVTARGRSPQASVVVVSDARGGFAFTALPWEFARLEAVHDGARGETNTRVPSRTPVTIALERGFAVRVHVVDDAGAAVSSARVSFAREVSPPNLTVWGPEITDDDGYATVVVTGAALYEIEAEHDERGVAVSAVTLDGPATVELLMPRGGVVFGRVVGPHGEQRPRADVLLSPAERPQLVGHRRGIADAEGRFRINGVAPGRYTLRVADPACDEPTIEVVKEAAADLEVEVVSLATAKLMGRVVNDRGVGQPGWGVMIQPRSSRSITLWTRTDAAGTFTATVCPSLAHMVAAKIEGRMGLHEMAVFPEDGLLTLRSLGGASLSVEVEFVGRAPPLEYVIRVAARRQTVSGRSATFEDLEPGVQKVSVHADDFVATGHEVKLVAGERASVRLVVRAGATLAGRVTAGRGGPPVGGARLMAHGPDVAGGFIVFAETGSDGRFVLRGLELGPNVLDVVADPQFARLLGHQVDVARESPPLELWVNEVVGVSGRVHDGRNAVAGAVVTIANATAVSRGVGVSADDGSFVVEGLAPEPHGWTVLFGNRVRFGTLDIPLAGFTGLDVDMAGAGGRLLLTLGESPFRFVRVRRGHVPYQRERGDDLARVLVEPTMRDMAFVGLEPGPYTVFVEDDQDPPTSQVYSVVITAGVTRLDVTGR